MHLWRFIRAGVMTFDSGYSLWQSVYNDCQMRICNVLRSSVQIYQSVDCHLERESWRCAPCARSDTSSRATNLVALNKAERQQTTICCNKDLCVCCDKSQAIIDSKSSPTQLRSITRPAKDPLTWLISYWAGRWRPANLGRWIDPIRITENLSAPKIYQLILEAISAKLCCPKDKITIDLRSHNRFSFAICKGSPSPRSSRC